MEILNPPGEQRRPLLRRMENELDRWEAQMTPEQKLWRQRGCPGLIRWRPRALVAEAKTAGVY